jgi:hypothetical protein
VPVPEANAVTWSAPDARGICTASLTPPGRVTLKGRRLRRAAAADPSRLVIMPSEWIRLLTTWLRPVAREGMRRRWAILLKEAGNNRVSHAHELLQLLLACGAVTVDERFERGQWHIREVEFHAPAGLRTTLGLPDPQEAATRWAATSGIQFSHPELAAAREALQDLPARTALTRLELLQALQRWHDDGHRSGTLRDFAYFARGATKAVSDAEWRWLAERVDLAGFGLAAHTPLLLVSAPLALRVGEHRFALSARPFLGLAPDTFVEAIGEGTIECWHLVENRTSFERLCREGRAATLWLPGYPPTWWREAVALLLALAPAPARIACDPDPAGIAIALAAGEVWQDAQLSWEPWRMDAALLASLPHRQPLTAHDRTRLTVLMDKALPSTLAELAQWMLEHGEKGEQEGFL